MNDKWWQACENFCQKTCQFDLNYQEENLNDNVSINTIYRAYAANADAREGLS